jgi:hypothetical protein
MADKPKWQEFEELVAAIEEAAAPRGAVVTRDDQVVDIITGEKRQVDASIRFRAGSTDILILIECRDRDRTEDVRWVEEMVMKLRGLAASKIILVSSTGFTEPARTKAKHYGVELRELSKINADAIHDWFLPHGIVHLFRLVEDTKCCVVLAADRENQIEIDANQAVLLHKLVHTPFPPVAFLNFIEMTDPKRFWAVPLDGSKTPVTMEFDGSDPNLIPVPLGVPKPEGSQLSLLKDGMAHEIATMTLTFRISYHAAAFAHGDGKHHLYGAPEGGKIQHSQFKGEVFGLPVTFEHQAGDEGASATVTFPSGLKLPSTLVGLQKDEESDDKEDQPNNEA